MRSIRIVSIIALGSVFTGCGAGAGVNLNSHTATGTSDRTPNLAAVNSGVPSNQPSVSALGPGIEGQVFRLDDAGIQFLIPKGFKISKTGHDTVLTSADDGVSVRFSVIKDRQYQAVIADQANEIDVHLKEVRKDGDPVARQIGEMDSSVIKGTAKDPSGKAVAFELTIINAPKSALLANVYGEQVSIKKNALMIKACLNSITKVA